MHSKFVLLNTLYRTPFDAGAEKVVSLFRDGLNERGEATRVFSIAPPGESGPEDEPSIRSANIYFPYPERRHSRPAKLAYHLLDNYNPVAIRRVAASGVLDDAQVLFTHNLRGFSAGVWSLNNRAGTLVRVHFIHDYQLVCTASTMFKGGHECATQCRSCRMLTQGRKRLSGYVDIVYGASQYVLDRHLELGLFPNALHRVIQPPLKINSMENCRPLPQAIRRFGFFGRVVEDKGIAVLVAAFRKFRENLPEAERGQAELIVAGGGSGQFFDEMLSQIQAIDGASYLGTMPPERYFERIDALVVPSTWPDPNPMVVVEAYQFMRPVIGAFVGGVRKSVIEGKTGLHFVHDAQNAGLIAALQRAWDGLSLSADEMRRQVSARDYRLAVETFVGDVDTYGRPHTDPAL